jgi:tetratricopeptide (TPR) repeat protein
VRDEPFGDRRGRGEPAWADASTDSWAAVVPGQHHPSESVPEPPPGRVPPDKARGHVYSSSARGGPPSGREADRQPAAGPESPAGPSGPPVSLRVSLPSDDYRLPIPGQPIRTRSGREQPPSGRMYGQPSRPAGPPSGWFSGIDVPSAGLPIVAGAGDHRERYLPNASTGTLVGPLAPTSPGPTAPPSPAASPPSAAGAPPVPSAPSVPSAPPADGAPSVSGPPRAVASPDTVLPVAGTAAGAATALRAPTMLTPIVRPRTRPGAADATEGADASTRPEPSAAGPRAEPIGVVDPAQEDPEQLLAAYDWRFHHETLRELVENPDELRAIRDRLTEKVTPATDNGVRARLLSLRAVVSRILGDLGKALADGKLALVHAEATGELRRIAIAQARLAHVLQWRGEFQEADRLFELANSPELPDRLRATMHEHAGRSSYDQGRYMEACNHFEHALELRKVEDPGLIARTELALDAVFRKVAENGWGPYPRSREEILRLHRAPVPTFNERVQRWGYNAPDGEVAVAPSYADVQPFRDGVAWVRRPEVETWELIDESGALLIPATAGYLGVGSFSDGSAWVSRDGARGWVAIDKTNRVTISTGFDDVRPFRRGIAAVRRSGRWGAVDGVGRVVVPLAYDAFVTALTDGRYVDGFTDEGLAIVDEGGRKGVVDRSGKVIVPPAHPAIVIHPVAFLVAGPSGQWGALDRRGAPLIDPVHPSRTVVIDEVDRLLADTKPVL